MAVNIVERRNPYVVLGVPFGASRDAASAAFARRARGLRRSPEGAKLLPELTWALNQIEEVLKAPELALEIYRVPADPSALVPSGSGILSPPPVPLPRRTHVSEHELATLQGQATDEALRAVRAEIGRRAELPPR
jgi:hypothetical protein